MKVAVADMTDDRRQDAACFDVALRLGDTFGKPRQRDADIGRDHRCAGPQREIRQGGVVARLPELGAILRLGGPLKWAPAKLCGNLTEAF
jgi:hypothetical protein